MLQENSILGQDGQNKQTNFVQQPRHYPASRGTASCPSLEFRPFPSFPVHFNIPVFSLSAIKARLLVPVVWILEDGYRPHAATFLRRSGIIGHSFVYQRSSGSRFFVGFRQGTGRSSTPNPTSDYTADPRPTGDPLSQGKVRTPAHCDARSPQASHPAACIESNWPASRQSLDSCFQGWARPIVATAPAAANFLWSTSESAAIGCALILSSLFPDRSVFFLLSCARESLRRSASLGFW